MSGTYVVSWNIHIMVAESAEDAARQALAIQRDKNSIATLFKVQELGQKDSVQVDLRHCPDAKRNEKTKGVIVT